MASYLQILDELQLREHYANQEQAYYREQEAQYDAWITECWALTLGTLTLFGWLPHTAP